MPDLRRLIQSKTPLPLRLMWTEITEHISRVTNHSFVVLNCQSVGGGSINQAFLLQAESQAYFLKLNQPQRAEMFAAEMVALQQMADTATIRVPQPICWGVTDQYSYLVLEGLELGGSKTNDWPEMGRQLARMHHHPCISKSSAAAVNAP